MKFIKYIICSLLIVKSFSLPSGAQVASGQLTQDQIDANNVFYYTTDKTVINWQDFSIMANESVNFVQPSELSSVLNRVQGANISEILGNLNSNGKVFLINPNGILIGKDAQIQTAHFLASTLNIADVDFLNENLTFINAPEASIINLGSIKTTNGDVTIFAKTIKNEGTIDANGSFIAAIGEEILLQPDFDNKVVIKTKTTNSKGFINSNTIKAIQHEVQTYADVVGYAINLDSNISKKESLNLGKIHLEAKDSKIFISGNISQDQIDIIADDLYVDNLANIKASNSEDITISTKNTFHNYGSIKAPNGNISIDNEGQKFCFNEGVIDISGSQAKEISIQIPRLVNGGKIFANSSIEAGGQINIVSDRFVEEQGGHISVNSKQKKAGIIDVYAKDRFFSSGKAEAIGKLSGGEINFTTDDDKLLLVANSINCSGKENGQINLTSNQNLLTLSSFTSELLGACPGTFVTADLVDPNQGNGSGFGNSILALSSGNIVVTKPNDNANENNAGAVYLYNGNTLALISTFLGASASDLIGSQGAVELTNGNYVIRSNSFNSSRGAVTFGNKTTGVSGSASFSNSLVGGTGNDQIGSGGVTALTNGNYAVSSPNFDAGTANIGAATWGDGTSGTTGTVTSVNSIIGSKGSDKVSSNGITALTNGNFVVSSPLVEISGTGTAGAATFVSGAKEGSLGRSGTVSTTNSLTGKNFNDQVSIGGVTPLNNGNYVVSSRYVYFGVFHEGAATWGSGTVGVKGEVSSANSLIGSSQSDAVGASIVALTNGNYVVNSPAWDNPAGTADVGAATWGNGSTGITGTVSLSNSLTGDKTNDSVGRSVLPLTNGNYVVSSRIWNSPAGTADVGAATWGNGSTGITGIVSSSNSIIGSTAFDRVGFNIEALTNGNYVINSYLWNSSSGTAQVGAVTWGNGSTGITGVVSSSNSIIGSTEHDWVGFSVAPLTNGNYVILSSQWNSPSTGTVGAATFASGAVGGSIGRSGIVTTANSLVGSSSFDFSIDNDPKLFNLANENYVLLIKDWNDEKGAVTWGSGTIGVSGAISASNSLVGESQFDLDADVIVLSNGNYVVSTPGWNNYAGAAAFADGSSGLTGTITSLNSLVGTTSNQFVGLYASALSNGNYVIISPFWKIAGNALGAVTLGNGDCGVIGSISTLNSVIGKVAGGLGSDFAFDSVYEKSYFTFSNDDTSGRVAVIYFLAEPTPTPSGFTPSQLTKIRNTTFAARAEMFTKLHPFDEYIRRYLELKFYDHLPLVRIKKNKKSYFIENFFEDKMNILDNYFIRQRYINNSDLEVEKTL